MQPENISLTSFLRTDYLLFDQQLELDELSYIHQHNPDILLFQQMRDGYVQLLPDEDRNAFYPMPLPTIDADATMFQALEKLTTGAIALLIEQDSMIGYISLATMNQYILEMYEKQQALLETILRTCEDSCTAINEQRQVITWSKGAEKLFSIPKKQIIGKPITDFFTIENLQILKTLENGISVYQHQHFARDGFVVLINSNPVYYQDQIIGAVVSEKDITSQIRLNQELYKTSEKLFHLEEEVRKTNATYDPFAYIKGNSTKLEATFSIARKAAKTDAPVLIHGESGVGKELFAKAIHHLREKDNAPYVAINCGAISSSLFESEIFGYVQGAFSGADRKGKKGKVELAKGGTLFLDEIGEMPLEMQVKFLRLLQEKKFYPLGATKEIEVDFRVIAATNRNLKTMIQNNDFREDLYYRLNVVQFTIPPLRARTQDIIELTHYFLYEMSVKYNQSINGISQTVMQSLLQHDWPGNIRELKNMIERMVVMSENGQINHKDLPFELEQTMQSEIQEHKHQQIDTMQHKSLYEQLRVYEKDIVLNELKRSNNNKQLCAKNLGITRATLYNRIKKLEIN